MHTIPDLLNLARAQSQIPSDNKLADAMGVARAQISQWRHGRHVPRDEQAAVLARLAQLPDDYVLLCIYAATTEHEDVRKVIRQIAGKIKRTAAALIAAIAVFLGLSTPSPSRASTDQHAHATYYVCF